jgi:hypothetical protein
VDFLQVSNIPYELHWKLDSSQTMYGADYFYDTLIRFPRGSDAILFKLACL